MSGSRETIDNNALQTIDITNLFWSTDINCGGDCCSGDGGDDFDTLMFTTASGSSGSTGTTGKGSAGAGGAGAMFCVVIIVCSSMERGGGVYARVCVCMCKRGKEKSKGEIAAQF